MDKLERKIFLICPVRDADKKKEKEIRELIGRIEYSTSQRVYYPKDHTPQDDPVGNKICSTNRQAIRNAEKVMLYYDPTSQGTVFDIGMSFMADKPFFIANPEALKSPKPSELEKFLSAYSANSSPKIISDFYLNALTRMRKIKGAKKVEYEWKGNTKEFLFDFGMAFMAEKPIALLNREYVESQKTPEKSFQNFLLKLDDKYRQARQ